MKKIKVMLVAITVISAVGGAFAFKAKKFTTDFCTRTHSSGAGACAAAVFTGKEDNTNGVSYRGYQKVTNCNAQCSNTITLTTTEP